ncbi:MAG: TolC family protein [Kiritimatiellae bacterium]|nr:TolC family protein [Kiritimatiellia bacterium]
MRCSCGKMFIILGLCAVICSCSALKPGIRSDHAELLPDAYSSVHEFGSVSTNAWWQSFENRELDRLMDIAFEGNLSLVQMGARLRQAHALARKSGSAMIPEITVTAGAGSSDVETTAKDGVVTKFSTDSYSLGFAAGYELDLWGRVWSVRQAGRLTAEASRRDMETAVMTISARVADVWLRVVEAGGHVRLLKEQIKTNKDVLDLLKKKMVKAGVPLLNIYQQEQVMLAMQARLPAAMQRLELLQNELTLLLGCPVGHGPKVFTTVLPDLPVQSGAGVPVDLLVSRPDVEAARFRLEAAGYDVAAARADRLPAIRLTAKYEYSAETTALLFDNWLSNLAAGLMGPLLDGGRRRAEVVRAKALLDERLAAYREVILEAVREVEDALIGERRIGERLVVIERQLKSSQFAFDEVTRRYLKGGSDYMQMLTTLRNTQQVERDVLNIRRELLSNRVTLYRALGGEGKEQRAKGTRKKGKNERT